MNTNQQVDATGTVIDMAVLHKNIQTMVATSLIIRTERRLGQALDFNQQQQWAPQIWSTIEKIALDTKYNLDKVRNQDSLFRFISRHLLQYNPSVPNTELLCAAMSSQKHWPMVTARIAVELAHWGGQAHFRPKNTQPKSKPANN